MCGTRAPKSASTPPKYPKILRIFSRLHRMSHCPARLHQTGAQERTATQNLHRPFQEFLLPARPGLGSAHLGQHTTLRCAKRVTTRKGGGTIYAPMEKQIPSSKKQVPNTRKSSKLQRPNKRQSSKDQTRSKAPQTKPEAPGACRTLLLFSNWEFADWDLLGTCDLSIGICCKAS